MSCATGLFLKGLDRLSGQLAMLGETRECLNRELPPGSPMHRRVPYAFKAWAMKRAEALGYTTLLWCDSSILPIRSFVPLWEQIERDGYFVMNNGFSNYEWTDANAYKYLFPSLSMEVAREQNRQIKHIVGGIIGIDLSADIGRAFLAEWYRLAQTNAFCGPWRNINGVCGPDDVRGHRHDQTALSVVASRLGCVLTEPPNMFAYAGHQSEDTVAVADGSINAL